jgi:hypothetical protein
MDDVKHSASLVNGFTAMPLRKSGNFEAQYLFKRTFRLFNSPYVKELPDDCAEKSTVKFLSQEAGI